MSTQTSNPTRWSTLYFKMQLWHVYLHARAQDSVIGGLFRDLFLEAARRRGGSSGGVGLTRVPLRFDGGGGRGHNIVVVVAVTVAAVDVGRLGHHHADALVQPLYRLKLEIKSIFCDIMYRVRHQVSSKILLNKFHGSSTEQWADTTAAV